MAHKQWVFDPDSGGIKIPECVRQRIEHRLRRYAEAHRQLALEAAESGVSLNRIVSDKLAQ